MAQFGTTFANYWILLAACVAVINDTALAQETNVTTLVILNNTGLPDSEVYINLSNTALSGAPCPGVSMSDVFQWYGGTGSVAATQITDAMVPQESYYPITLADLQGWVLSNAASATNPPTTSDSWWIQQNYSSLGLNNNPAAPATGIFPTISLSLFGTCNEAAPNYTVQYAGRIAFSAIEAFSEDTFSSASPVAPYVVIEGSIYPSDTDTLTIGTTQVTYPAHLASNFDVSYVDQIGIPADIMLWGPASRGDQNYSQLPVDTYATGGPLVCDPSTYSYFAAAADATPHIIQQNVWTDTSTQTNYSSFYSFTHDLSGSGSTPFETFLGILVQDTWPQGQTSAPATHPMLKVSNWGSQTFVGGIPQNVGYLAFNDGFYGAATGYSFGGYVGYFTGGTPPCTDPFWQAIVGRSGTPGWLQTDLPAAAAFVPNYLPSPCFLDPGEYMLLVGGFPSSGSLNMSLFPNGAEQVLPPGYPANGMYSVSTVNYPGPVSMQLETTGVQGCTYYDPQQTGTPCTLSGATVQSYGTAPGPDCTPRLGFLCWNPSTHGQMNGSFPTSTTIGINFWNQNASGVGLGQFKLAAGLTTATSDGTLTVTLNSVTPSGSRIATAPLARVTVTIPSAGYAGGTAADVADSGSPASNWLGWPLEMDWSTQSCTFIEDSLTATWEYYDSGTWTSSTGPSDSNWITACTIPVSPPTKNNGYQLQLEGNNVTIATTHWTPQGVVGSAIAAGLFDNGPAYYTDSSFNTYNFFAQAENGHLAFMLSLKPNSPEAGYLHVAAIPMASLQSATGISGNNPAYRFFRYNLGSTAWEESVGTGAPMSPPWPSGTQFTPNGPCASPCSTATATTTGIVNDVSGRVVGDACAAFSYGMFDSTIDAEQFDNWPTDAGFPPQSHETLIGELTTGQFFRLCQNQVQPTNAGQIPIGSNIHSLPDVDGVTVYTYDPYVDIGVNRALSNEYFSGFGDRLQGGFMTPAFNWAVDGTNKNPDMVQLGYVPGTPQTPGSLQQNVIVIRLHAIASSPTSPSASYDLDRDNHVSGGDIQLLLLNLGPCGEGSTGCTGDFDNTGSVDHGDVALMLLNLGPC